MDERQNTYRGIADVKERRGLKFPLSFISTMLYPEELRANVPYFINWCQSCGDMRAHYICLSEAEVMWLCISCHEYCFQHAHNWEEISCNIKKGQ